MAKHTLRTHHIILLIGFLIVLSSIITGFISYTKIYSLSKNIISLSELKPLPENEGKIIYLSGVIDTTSGTVDDTFLINRQALKLYREVEILDEDNNGQLIWTQGHRRC